MGLVSWVLSKIMGIASKGLLDKALGYFNQVNGTALSKDKVDADTAKAAMQAYVEAHKSDNEKLGSPWFWIIAFLMLTPVMVYFWMLTLYNILWWQHGIYPQYWSIAAYPGIYGQWASDAFHFVFAPALGIGLIAKMVRG